MNDPFFREFKNIVLKEHLKKATPQAGSIIERMCYLGEVDGLSKDTEALCRLWYNDIFRFSLIERLIDSAEDFEEIIIHHVKAIQKDGEIMDHPLSWEDEDIFQSFQFFCDGRHIDWNEKDQFASFNAPVGDCFFRFTLIHPSLNPQSGTAKIFIRSHKRTNFSVGDFTTSDLTGLLKDLVLHKKNIIISGPTGAGKTALLRTLLGFVPPRDHVVVIEDAGEVRLKGDFVSYLVSPDLEKAKNFCAYALRMSPDRIILGEIRSHEIVPFILSSNTGHKGMASTIHANSAVDTLSRLSTLFSLFSPTSIRYDSIQRLIHKCVDYVIYMENKEIVEIIKVIGLENDKTIYESVHFS